MPEIINPNNFRRVLAECAAQIGGGALHIFGYGSLMWRPGFRVRESAAARVHGYSRRLSVRSTHYRGTAQKPGLVFGLDAGGSCNGVVLFAAGNNERILRNLFRREMFANVYEPRFVRARLSGGGVVRALTFVVRRDGRQYVPPMPPQRAAEIIRAAEGFGGGNADYVKNTREELSRRGIPCPQLARLCALL
ncbi:MAG: gamma-glutamylcyclotransferase [Gammaproteobacteria bacterium]